MKIRFLNRQAKCFPLRSRAGMTLVEVVFALGISVLMVAGIVSSYIYGTAAAIKAELAQAANAKALERIEQARSVQWDPTTWQGVDNLVASNFPDEVVTLDMPGTNAVGTTATVQTTIAQLSVTPPLRSIHVDCIWQFRGGELITNSIETIRAP
jgi:type II secretory pathway pseudopilin PulG